MDKEQLKSHEDALKSIYRPFFDSDGGVDLLNYLEGQKQSALNRALVDPEPVKAWAELQKASAYVVIKEYIERKLK